MLLDARQPMTSDGPGLREALRGVSVWKRGSERAPHKPLLLLSRLAAVQRGESRLAAYDELHERLSGLLVDFGPPRQSVHPEYPFWRLQNDGTFWEVPERREIERQGGVNAAGDVAKSTLLDVDARGGFSRAAYDLLRGDPDLVNELVAAILDEHFPRSLHESILEAVGMPWVVSGTAATRDPDFRREVVRLYEHRCAMCGFDGRLGASDLALEAAHIMWHALGGPDQATNGVLLCSIHHQALDRGAMGISDDRSILVSQELHGGSRVDEFMIGLAGLPLRAPADPKASPGLDFIAWHQREVFRGPARPPGRTSKATR